MALLTRPRNISINSPTAEDAKARRGRERQVFLCVPAATSAVSCAKLRGVATPPEVFLPTHLNQRDGLTRQCEAQLDLTVFAINPLRRSQQLKLSGGFEPRVLLRRRILWRPHLFPYCVSVAVVVVNAVVLDQHAPRRGRHATDRQTHRAVWRRHIVVMIIPGHHRNLKLR